MALLAVALVKVRSSTVVTAVAGLGACWTLSAWSQGSNVSGGTVFVAAALLVVAELALASFEQVSVRDEGELVARRLAGIAARGLGALVLAAILVAALGLHAGGGLVLEAVGVAAAVGLLLLVHAVSRRDWSTTER